MQVRDRAQYVANRLKVRRRVVRNSMQRMKRPNFVPKTQQQIVADGEQASFQRSENRKLVVRPFNGIESRANGFHFLALMKGSGLPELMGYVPSLQRVYIIAGHVLAPRHESPEENGHMLRSDRYQHVSRIGVSHFPSAFPN